MKFYLESLVNLCAFRVASNRFFLATKAQRREEPKSREQIWLLIVEADFLVSHLVNTE
jgi:hypothetical protein